MKIYLLKAVNRVGYDEYDGFVVAAENETEARQIANDNSADDCRIWNDPLKVRCERLKHTLAKGLILGSFNAG